MRRIASEKDICYTEVGGVRKTLFVAYAEERCAPLPAVVHIHGGGWRQGSASQEAAARLAREGFVGISINYRLSQEAIFPAAAHDCKTAIRWVRAHAAEYGIDPDRIGVMGESAGGHLAALVGTSAGDAYLEGDGGYREFSSRVQAVVDQYGPTDFLYMNAAPGKIDHDAPDSPESAFIGGPIQQHRAQVRLANPITYIDRNAPPTLIMHGRSDMAVPFNQSELLYAALQKAGVVVELVSVENAGHGFKPDPADAVIAPGREEIAAKQIEWFRTHL